ncbi:MAG TPA: rRNA maturation RNAse YbeY [Lacunisphaera sp.]
MTNVPPIPREISIRNAHPRLHVPRAAVAKAITLLDERFEMLSGDLPYLSLPRPRLEAFQPRIKNPKSKIRGSCPAGELSLVFLTDPALAKIHGDFMSDPTATDVITFEGDVMAGLAGEICVSADTAAKYVGLVEGPRPRESGSVEGSAPAGPRPSRSSALHKTRLAGTRALQNAFAIELTLYVVHGWLHLAGYDDLQPAKKRRMRAAEARAMKLLQEAAAIPAFQLK